MPILQFSDFRHQLSALPNKIPNRGFTLIELIVTMGIIVVLSTIGIASYTEVQKNTRDTRRQQDLNTIMNGVVFYTQANNNTIPAAATGTVAAKLGVAGTGTSNLSPNFINTLPEDPSCSPGSPSDTNKPCYYYIVINSSTNTFGIAAKMENSAKANVTGCTAANAGVAVTMPVTSLNYCVTP